MPKFHLIETFDDSDESKGGRQKHGCFTVKMTVSIDPSAHPPPKPNGQLFVTFFRCVLTLEYDYMCSETDFTQEVKRICLGGNFVLL